MRIRTFSIRPPRHPLLRILALAAAAVVTAGLLLVGLVTGAAVLLAAGVAMACRRLLQRAPRKADDPGIIEGEFTVLHRPRTALPRQD